MQQHSALRRNNYLISEINARYHDACVKLGLSDSAMMVFYTLLCEGDSCPLRTIYHDFGVSKQTINSALRHLEAQGHIQLQADSGLKKLVSFTPQGKALAERTVGKIIALENDIFSTWPQEDVEKYNALTQRYLHDISLGVDAL